MFFLKCFAFEILFQLFFLYYCEIFARNAVTNAVRSRARRSWSKSVVVNVRKGGWTGKVDISRMY